MYVIIGASGHTGSAAAENLLAKGEKVRVLGRDLKRLERFVHKGAEAMAASVEDTAALTRAFTGANGVYAMIPPVYGDPDPGGYQERVSDAVAAALRQSRVPYAVILSSVGADRPDRTGPIVGLRNLERKVNDIGGLNTLSLRAGYFLENFLAQIQAIQATGNMGGELRPDLKLGMIATRDIGAYAADALLRKNFTGKQIEELQGAGDRSCSEVAAVLGKAIGKPELKYVQLPAEQMKGALMRMGISAAMADQLSEMSESLNNGYIVPIEKRSPKNTTPTTVEQFAAEVFAPAFRAKAAAA